MDMTRSGITKEKPSKSSMCCSSVVILVGVITTFVCNRRPVDIGEIYTKYGSEAECLIINSEKICNGRRYKYDVMIPSICGHTALSESIGNKCIHNSHDTPLNISSYYHCWQIGCNHFSFTDGHHITSQENKSLFFLSIGTTIILVIISFLSCQYFRKLTHELVTGYDQYIITQNENEQKLAATYTFLAEIEPVSTLEVDIDIDNEPETIFSDKNETEPIPDILQEDVATLEPDNEDDIKPITLPPEFIVIEE